MARGQSWTAEEDAKLKAWRQDVFTILQIAGKLGRSVDAITMRMYRLGIPVRLAHSSEPNDRLNDRSRTNYSKEEDAYIEQSARAGVDLDVIANHLKRSPSAVYRRLKALTASDRQVGLDVFGALRAGQDTAVEKKDPVVRNLETRLDAIEQFLKATFPVRYNRYFNGKD